MRHITALLAGAAIGAAACLGVMVLMVPKEKDLADFFQMAGERE